MTTSSVYPATADNINDTDDPGLVTTLLADAINAIEADLITNGASSTIRNARVVNTSTAFVSGTGVKNALGYDADYSLNTTGAGSVVVALAPVGSSTYTAYRSYTLQATDNVAVTVPAGFSVKFTLTTSTPVSAFWTIL